MGAHLWAEVTTVLGRAIPAFCTTDEYIAAQLHLTPWQFAFGKAGIYLGVLLPFILGWQRSKNRIIHRGISSKVWRAGLYLLIGCLFFQVGRALIAPMIGDLVPCPYDLGALFLASFLVIYAAYFFHLGNDNKASFATFMVWIAGPLVGQVVFNSREAGETGVTALIRALEYGVSAIGHVAAIAHI